ncbi:hypothetical protein EIP86_004400 [Pleurotus ostreatoroseus]|nr:hypothetical protein EIP86_004400 [Pleurotus ostreatoroseus]
MLLVPGTAFFFGGIKIPEQKLEPAQADLNHWLLIMGERSASDALLAHRTETLTRHERITLPIRRFSQPSVHAYTNALPESVQSLLPSSPLSPAPPGLTPPEHERDWLIPNGVHTPTATLGANGMHNPSYESIPLNGNERQSFMPHSSPSIREPHDAKPVKLGRFILTETAEHATPEVNAWFSLILLLATVGVMAVTSVFLVESIDDVRNMDGIGEEYAFTSYDF